MSQSHFDPMVGESRWFEYILSQENILDNLVNKSAL